MRGTVLWYDSIKRFGFITDNHGTNYFVHKFDILNATELFKGDNVQFSPTFTEQNMKAIQEEEE